MEIISIKTRLFKENENLFQFIIDNIPVVEEGYIIVITSKVVALSQGRTENIKNKEEVIIKNSQKIIKTPWALLTLTNGGWCINAGVDESNADHKIILLPNNIFKTAELLRNKISKHFKLKNIGILITDTKSLPLRMGTVGRAVGFAGFEPFKNYIGKKDLFGKKSRFTKSNIADALSAAAVMNMGEGAEQIPLAVIKNAPIKFIARNNINKKSIKLDILPEDDIYSYIYKDIKTKGNKK
ncbi:MAG: coenzyme F420-0:L-glutamate ligase [Candidatus Paceibacterota bacterium]|jgi:F420-0:gamma-glutamyl ligase